MTAHAIGGCGIETVVAKEPSGMIRSQHLSVKEHADQVRIPGAEFHVMGDHDDGNSPALQCFQNLREGFLEETVDSLSRFVQKQEFRLGKQYLRQSSPL